jgi:hypothetical protein
MKTLIRTISAPVLTQHAAQPAPQAKAHENVSSWLDVFEAAPMMSKESTAKALANIARWHADLESVLETTSTYLDLQSDSPTTNALLNAGLAIDALKARMKAGGFDIRELRRDTLAAELALREVQVELMAQRLDGCSSTLRTRIGILSLLDRIATDDVVGVQQAVRDVEKSTLPDKQLLRCFEPKLLDLLVSRGLLQSMTPGEYVDLEKAAGDVPEQQDRLAQGWSEANATLARCNNLSAMYDASESSAIYSKEARSLREKTKQNLDAFNMVLATKLAAVGLIDEKIEFGKLAERALPQYHFVERRFEVDGKPMISGTYYRIRSGGMSLMRRLASLVEQGGIKVLSKAGLEGEVRKSFSKLDKLMFRELGAFDDGGAPTYMLFAANALK